MSDFTNSIQNRDVKFVERYATVDTAYTSTGTKTITVSTSGNAGLRSGYIHFRTKSVNAAATNTFRVAVDDGTNVQEVLPTTTITAAGVASNIVVPFQSDYPLTNFTLTIVNTNNGNQTVDVEVVGVR